MNNLWNLLGKKQHKIWNSVFNRYKNLIYGIHVWFEGVIWEEV